MLTRLETIATDHAVAGRMRTVVVDNHIAVDRQARAVVGRNAEGIFAFGFHFQFAGEADAVFVLVVVEFQLNEIVVKGPFARRLEL